MRCNSVGIDSETVDRGCGFLTKTERQFLVGEWRPGGEEPSEAQRKRKRHEIKVRTRHALADFALLQQYGSQELKSSVVELNAEVPVFDDETLEHMTDGLLRFTTDSTMGEGFTKLLNIAMARPKYVEPVTEMLEGLATNDPSRVESAVDGVIEDFDAMR